MKHVSRRKQEAKALSARLDRLLQEVCGAPQAFVVIWSPNHSNETNYIGNMSLANTAALLEEIATNIRVGTPGLKVDTSNVKDS